jgi:hypothetical protein
VGTDLTARARAAWAGYARMSAPWPPPGGQHVEVTTDSALCPPGWLGVVELGDARIATAPTGALAGLLDAALSADRLDDLPTVRKLGPARLAFLDAADFQPAHGDDILVLPAGDPAIAALAAANEPEASDEAGITEPDLLHAVARDGALLAAAGYLRWPGRVAHLCVLVDREVRGQRLARLAASSAVAQALDEGLLPQWRATLTASRRVAAGLGFRDLGRQLSLQPLVRE